LKEKNYKKKKIIGIWNKLANKLNKIQLGNRIKLDVGGTIFATSLSTLTFIKGTFFEVMFSGRWEPKKEEDGSFFIDRDPIVFRYILNFLRGEEIKIDKLSEDEKEMLLSDAKLKN
jgi:hypothetical protein